MAKTRAQLNRALRQDEMRKKIEASGYETHVHDCIRNLLNPEKEFSAVEVQRMNSAATLSLKMMAKFIPDLKSTEVTGEGGEALTINVQSFKDA